MGAARVPGVLGVVDVLASCAGPGGNLVSLHSRDGTRNPDPVQVALIHVREVVVSEGDRVRAGEVVAPIGDNGSWYHPHVHVGAFRGELFSDDAVPLQIRFDLAAMGRRPQPG